MHARFFSTTPGAEGGTNAGEPMTKNRRFRRVHRMVSTLFTLCVAANFIAMAWGPPPAWITYSPLPPLFVLMLTGLYMLVLPHVGAWRTRRRASSGGPAA
jgi:hypothetical protein